MMALTFLLHFLCFFFVYFFLRHLNLISLGLRGSQNTTKAAFRLWDDDDHDKKTEVEWKSGGKFFRGRDEQKTVGVRNYCSAHETWPTFLFDVNVRNSF